MPSGSKRKGAVTRSEGGSRPKKKLDVPPPDLEKIAESLSTKVSESGRQEFHLEFQGNVCKVM